MSCGSSLTCSSKRQKSFFFFLNDPATTEFYPLPLHDAFPIGVRFGLFSYWMNSYFGGAMAAIGGALVLGALPRIFTQPGWRSPAVMAAGIAILANSRPYEIGRAHV